MALWGQEKWGTFKWGEIPSYYGPAPPPVYEFVIPPECLDPQTPLMSIRATGHFRKTWMFRIHGHWVSYSLKHKVFRQEIFHYNARPYHCTPCDYFVRQAFAAAVHSWQTLTEDERAPFNAYVAHYGVCMSGYNRWIAIFMKQALADPTNPCDNPPRIDYRKLRRIPGRS